MSSVFWKKAYFGLLYPILNHFFTVHFLYIYCTFALFLCLFQHRPEIYVSGKKKTAYGGTGFARTGMGDLEDQRDKKERRRKEFIR